MKRALLAILAVGLFALADPSAAQLIDTRPEKFFEYITVADPYKEWQAWPGKDGPYRGEAAYGHGTLIMTYVNLPALRSISRKNGMADGSIIVVENYSENVLQTLTTMYKVNGFNRDGGDWYWLEATPAGRIINSGKVQACVDCHRARAANDYIWTGEVVKGKYKGGAP